MKKLIYTGSGNGVNAASFNLLDGAPASFDSVIGTASPIFSYSSGYKPFVAITPDATRCVISNYQYLSVFLDIEDLNTYTTPSVPPGVGYLCQCTASNDLIATGGSSGAKLMVYAWADLSVQAVNTQGLGTVYGVSFSHDGSMLAVVHSSSPYLRVYNTNDWSYADVSGNVGAGKYHVCFTADDSLIFCCGNGYPYYVAAVDAATISVVNTYTDSNNNYVDRTAGGIIPNPNKSKSVVYWYGAASSSRRQVGEIDYEAGTETDIWPYNGWGTRQVTHCCFDAASNQLLVKAYRSYGDAGLNVFDATTWEQYPSNPAFDILPDGYGHMAIAQKNTGRLTGTVRDISNNPAKRTVRAHDRATGVLLAQVESDATTGNYSMDLPDASPCDVQFMTEDGEQLNDLFFANAMPELVP